MKQKIINTFIVVAFCLLGVNLWGMQEQWQNYGTAEGAPSGAVRALALEGDKFVWIGADDFVFRHQTKNRGGVCRYDGIRFEPFGTGTGRQNERVNALLFDGDGRLWVGTTKGVYSCSQGEFERQEALAELEGVSVLTIFQEGQRSRKARNRVAAWFSPDRAEKRESERVFWFGTERKGVYRFDGKTLLHWQKKNGLISDTVRAIAQDKQGALWFGTPKGISVLPDQRGRRESPPLRPVSRTDFERLTIEDGLLSNDVLSLLVDDAGGVWIGTSDGLCRYHPEGNPLSPTFDKGGQKKFEGLTTEHFLPNNTIYTIFQSSLPEGKGGQGGFILVGTKGGVSRFSISEEKTRYRNWSVADGLASNEVYAIGQDREGGYWFGTDKGLSRYLSSIFNPSSRFL